MALDVGTSACHCLVADQNGRPVDNASAPMSYFTPEGCPPLAKEFNPEEVLQTISKLVAELLARLGLRGKDISAIGITSQRQGMVFLDGKGKELYCGPNIDMRAVFEGAAIDEGLGEEVYATTGHFPSMLLAPARLRWFRDNRAEGYQHLSSVLTIAGWLAYRLTGNRACEPTLEAEAGLLDISDRERCSTLMESLEVSASLLPPLAPAGKVVGKVSTRIAAQWGLRAGIPVTIAGPDTQCALLGMGLMSEGQAGAVLGWSCPLQILTSQPRLDEQIRTWAGCYPADGLWVAESNSGDAGNAYRWLKEMLVGKGTSFQEVDHLVGQVAPGCDGVVALLGPSPESAFKSGMGQGGILFPTPISFQEASPGQLLRAALESIAFSVKANLSTLEEVTDISIKSLHIGGSMARSKVLVTALANVLGTQVKRSVANPQVSARGAAMAAAVALGSFSSLEEATKEMDDSYQLVEPDTALSSQYQEYYEQWCQAYHSLASLN